MLIRKDPSKEKVLYSAAQSLIVPSETTEILLLLLLKALTFSPLLADELSGRLNLLQEHISFADLESNDNFCSCSNSAVQIAAKIENPHGNNTSKAKSLKQRVLITNLQSV
jgi:hypothetical protein